MSDKAMEAAQRLVKFYDDYDYVYWDGHKTPFDPDEDGVTVARAYLTLTAELRGLQEKWRSVPNDAVNVYSLKGDLERLVAKHGGEQVKS